MTIKAVDVDNSLWKKWKQKCLLQEKTIKEELHRVLSEDLK